MRKRWPFLFRRAVSWHARIGGGHCAIAGLQELQAERAVTAMRYPLPAQPVLKKVEKK